MQSICNDVMNTHFSSSLSNPNLVRAEERSAEARKHILQTVDRKAPCLSWKGNRAPLLAVFRRNSKVRHDTTEKN